MTSRRATNAVPQQHLTDLILRAVGELGDPTFVQIAGYLHMRKVPSLKSTLGNLKQQHRLVGKQQRGKGPLHYSLPKTVMIPHIGAGEWVGYRPTGSRPRRHAALDKSQKSA